MTEDAELRRADRVERIISALYKSFHRAKAKQGRDLPLKKTLEGGSGALESVKKFLQDGRVTDRIRASVAAILQGQVTKSRYNTCLGLLTGHMMFR